MKKTIFRETLGNSVQIKVLDFLIANYSFNFTLTELMKNCKVGYSTLKIILPRMLKRKLVIIDKKVGKANLYKLNIDNPAIKYLMAFDWKSTKRVIDKEINLNHQSS